MKDETQWPSWASVVAWFDETTDHAVWFDECPTADDLRLIGEVMPTALAAWRRAHPFRGWLRCVLQHRGFDVTIEDKVADPDHPEVWEALLRRECGYCRRALRWRFTGRVGLRR